MVQITSAGDREVSTALQVLPIIPSGPPVVGSDFLSITPFVFSTVQRPIIAFTLQNFRTRELNTTGFSGAVDTFFGLEWWFGRVHIVPTSFLLGTVLTGVQRTWEFYNGKSTPVSVTSIIATADGGFTVTQGNLATPFTVQPFNSEVYTVTVSADGPDVIAAVYTFTTADADVRSVSFSGVRLILLSHEVDKPIREEWGFLTDILAQMDGVEQQRRAMRDVPREKLTYRFVMDELLAQRLDNQMFDWNRRLWALPDRTQFATLTAAAQAPDATLTISDTTDIDYRAGVNDSVVLYTDPDTFETAEVLSVATNLITLANPLTSALVFPIGTKVYPVRLGYGSQVFNEQQYKTGARVREITFDITRNADLGDLATALPTTYKSLPVFDRLLFTPGGQSVPVRFEFGGRPWDLDGIGKFTVFSFRNSPRITQPIRFYMDDRAEYVLIRKLIHGAKGRQKSFWMPSFRDDFVIETDEGAGVTLTIELAKYTAHVFGLTSNMRKDIEITYADGTVDLRGISNAAENVANETITLDSASSQVLTAANVRRISFINRVRFGSDSFIFLHTRRDYVVMDTTLVHIEG